MLLALCTARPVTHCGPLLQTKMLRDYVMRVKKIEACPYGAVPEQLVLMEGDTYNWMRVAGDCCHEWTLEGRTHRSQLPLDDEVNLLLAVETWNSAMRGNSGEADGKV